MIVQTQEINTKKGREQNLKITIHRAERSDKNNNHTLVFVRNYSDRICLLSFVESKINSVK